MSLPFPILSDPALRLGELLKLPTFQANGQPLYKRLTMIIRDGGSSTSSIRSSPG